MTTFTPIHVAGEAEFSGTEEELEMFVEQLKGFLEVSGLTEFRVIIGGTVTLHETVGLGRPPRRPTALNIGEMLKAHDRMKEFPLEDLELGIRSFNLLRGAGVKTTGDLVKMTLTQVNEIPGLGPKCSAEIVAVLESWGFCLRSPGPSQD